ncbi:hypothetical protein HQ447_17305 [bacterium]|nr:hypothetical protein [bacterium]
MTHLTDFSDKLSPMLVKELRQGMRARSFTMLFLIFQGLLAVILLSAGSASSSDHAGAIASGVIFTLFAGAALVIQPMRGVNALSAEITGNTIEMMVLTRLSAWRIVFGKWIAIVSQTALLLVTIIPYLILRYFFGGMVLLGELVFLTLIFLTSVALTAVMVGLSGNSTKIFRMLPILGFIFMLQLIPVILFRGGFNNFMDYCTLSNWESRATIFAYVGFIAYLGWCALSFGTSVIAPVAENHSTIRRLIALGLTCLAAAAGLHPDIEYQTLLSVFCIILAPAVITALTEPSVMLPPICKPFLNRGLAGRIAGVFLLPGWPSGVFYTTLLLLISGGGVALSVQSKAYASFGVQDAIGGLALLGGVLLPALLAAKFSKHENKRFPNFVVFLLALVILVIVPTIFANINDHKEYLWLFAWNPLIFLSLADDNTFEKNQLLAFVAVVDFIILALLWFTAIVAYRGYRPIFQEAQALPQP